MTTGTRSSGGPPIPQPMHPIVDFWLGGIQLSHKAGRPYRVESFTVDIKCGGIVSADIVLFDPEWLAVEALLLERSRQASGTAAPTVAFRWGYTGSDGTVVWSRVLGLEGYFVGTVTNYDIQLSSYGTHITMHMVGFGATDIQTSSNEKRTSRVEGLPVKEAIKKIAEDHGCEVKAIWDRDGNAEPEELPDVDSNMDSSEAENGRARVSGDLGPVDMIRMMLSKVRPKSPDYNSYIVHAISHAPPGALFDANGQLTSAKTTIVIDCIGADKSKSTLRNWTYMSDAKTDIIAWQPQIWGSPFVEAGGAGLMLRAVDLRRRKHYHQQYNEELSKMRIFPRDGKKLADIPDGSDGKVYAPPSKGTLDGSRTHPNQRRPRTVVKGDEPYYELGFHGDFVIADRVSLNHFLEAYSFLCNYASMTIIGDPWLTDILQLVNVNVLLPMRDRTGALLHYSSGTYCIISATHSISGGSYTTTLQLARSGVPDGVNSPTGDKTNAPVYK